MILWSWCVCTWTGILPIIHIRHLRWAADCQSRDWKSKRSAENQQQAGSRYFIFGVAMPHYADVSLYSDEENELWNKLIVNQDKQHYTMKRLPFVYFIKGNEMFVSRKDKSITRATVNQAYHKAKKLMESDGEVSGAKKLGTFGASYLYPIFIELEIIK